LFELFWNFHFFRYNVYGIWILVWLTGLTVYFNVCLIKYYSIFKLISNLYIYNNT